MTPEDELKASLHSFARGLEEAIAEAVAKAIAPLEARVRELEQREIEDLLADDVN